MTIGQYLERWIGHKLSDGTRLKTVVRYEQTVKKQLFPTLGKLKLEKLRPLDVENALNTIREAVSAKAARRSRTILSMSLNQAVRWQLLPRNVCQAVRRPAIPHDEEQQIRFWTPEESRCFLEVARTHRHFALFHTGLLTGLRTCELLGLRWRDVDFEAGTLRIEQDAANLKGQMIIVPVKTKSSRRTVTISQDTVAVLQEHRERQALERHKAQEGYQDKNLVFASEIGTVTGYQNLRVVFLKLIARASVSHWQSVGLIATNEPQTHERFRELLKERPELTEKILVGEIGLHGLRHTHAAVLIRRGLNAKVVSDRLGHTSVAFTLTCYGHVFDEQRREAAISIHDFLGLKKPHSPELAAARLAN